MLSVNFRAFLDESRLIWKTRECTMLSHCYAYLMRDNAQERQSSVYLSVKGGKTRGVFRFRGSILIAFLHLSPTLFHKPS